ncbi:Interactor of constitutive active ROPs 4 [Acorus calamus]|uniref:Interactor of constitutive active ROPs 4 n=1 Tax=Acorus calamus TaxID=4465 RepID=A0AAV9FJ14_ACOCL|nr:Interactor of constitutive active ROPs 4 [Acorus calamus]
MPRSRGSEMPQQRQSSRVPLQLRTSSADSDGTHRAVVDRSPKVSDRRSPRNSLHEKKRVTKVTDLESQLGQAQDQLKKLKEQLACAEAAKLEARQELEETKKRIPPDEQTLSEEVTQPEEDKAASENSSTEVVQEVNVPKSDSHCGIPDALEVVTIVSNTKLDADADQALSKEEETRVKLEEEKSAESLKQEEIEKLKDKLEGKERELMFFSMENEILKKRTSEAEVNLARSKVMEEEVVLKLTLTHEELRDSRLKAVEALKRVGEVEGAKEALEAEMKRLKVQMEQWKKAANAAAAVLATDGFEVNGRRVSERCGSMDQHIYGDGYVPGYDGFGSPLTGDGEDGFDGGKRKGSGIRMFGDLWRKKGQK